jgi:hypothetical protein
MYLRTRFRRSAVLSALALGLLTSSLSSRSEEFDQRRRSPQLANPTQLKTELRERIDRSAKLGLAERVRSEGADGRWVNLTWQLNRIAQAGQELPDLSEFGLKKQADGSYEIDVAKNPQWELWDMKLSLLENPEVFELHAQRLRERGFREQDVAILKKYLGERSAKLAALEAEKSMVRSIAAQRAVTRGGAEDPASYLYQLELAREKAKKTWAADLLQKLDSQRQRILASFYQELGGKKVFVPEKNLDQNIAIVVEQLASGKYEQHLIQMEQEIRK